jgi:hypothetical protein
MTGPIIRVDPVSKVIIWLATKIPGCRWRDEVIRFFLNRMVSIKDPLDGRWRRVTGVRFKGIA